MSDEAIERRMIELREVAAKFATKFAHKEYLEEFKKSKLAILMKQAEREGFGSAVAQEREARAHPEYLELLKGLEAATEESEALRWQLKLAEIGVDVWRTQQSNKRVERKGYGA